MSACLHIIDFLVPTIVKSAVSDGRCLLSIFESKFIIRFLTATTHPLLALRTRLLVTYIFSALDFSRLRGDVCVGDGGGEGSGGGLFTMEAL